MFVQNKNREKLFLMNMLFLMFLFSFTVRAQASWVKNDDGTYSYKNADGSIAKDKWIGKNYYVDAEGIRLKGKQQIDSKWYYFSKKTGKLIRKKWIKESGHKYYATKDGTLYANGLYKIGKYKYLFDSEGIMGTGMCSLENKTYYLNPQNGRMMKSLWVKIETKYYYFGENGVMLKNKWLSKYTYYVGSDGSRQTSRWKSGRYLGSNGKSYSGLHKIDGEYYYFNAKTRKKTVNALVKIKNERWYFDSDGKGAKNNVPEPGAGVSVQPEYYTQPVVDDETLLSYIIYCEAGNQSYVGKVAVGYVILNRVYSKLFRASTIREVVYEKNQFNPTWDGAMARVFKNPSIVTADCKKAAKYVLKMQPSFKAGKTVKLKVNGKKIKFTYLFYMRPESYQRLHLTAAYTKIGDHVFFKVWK